MTEWDQKDHMGKFAYIQFKRGKWVEVSSVPEWVRNAPDPPPKTEIPANGSVEAVFTGDSLEYRVTTRRLPRGAGTYLDVEYEVRIKDT